MAKAPYKTPYGDAQSVTTILYGALKWPPEPFVIKALGLHALMEMFRKESSFNSLADTKAFYWDSEEKLKQKIKYLLNEHLRTAQAAMDFGTFIHNAIEVFYKERPMPKEEYVDFIGDFAPKSLVLKNLNYTIPIAVKATLSAFFKCIEENNVEILESEKPVYFNGQVSIITKGAGVFVEEIPILFGGTLDMRAWVLNGVPEVWSYPRLGNKALMLGDLKTGKEDDGHWKQLVAYVIAEEQTNGGYHEGAFRILLDNFNYGKYNFSVKPRKELLDKYWPQFVGAYLNFSGMKKA